MKLQEGEEVLLEVRPEANLLVIWFFSRSIWLGLIGGFIGFGLCMLSGMFDIYSESEYNFVRSALIATITGVVILIIAHTYFIFLKRTYKYTITNRRCIFSAGILHRVRHSVPYHKVTDVEMSQYIIERILGISTLGIYTPGTGSMSGSYKRRPEIMFVGLKDNEKPAELINEMLSKFKATGE